MPDQKGGNIAIIVHVNLSGTSEMMAKSTLQPIKLQTMLKQSLLLLEHTLARLPNLYRLL